MSQTIWVCWDCLNAHANDEWADDRTHPPLRLIQDYEELTLGMALEEHGKECIANGEPVEECGCEHIEYSTRRCDGCGSPLAGSRDAMTLWIRGE